MIFNTKKEEKMRVMGTDGVENVNPVEPEAGDKGPADNPETKPAEDEQPAEDSKSIFGEAMASTTEDSVRGMQIKITPEEKVAFVDALVGNERFKLSYDLFGGKAKIVVRSMTFEETRALSEWCVRNAPKDIGGQISGKFRRFMLCAQIEMYNGTKMSNLAEPLFETLDKDGKTVTEPGWLKQADFWDGMPTAVISALSKCVADFNRKYDYLISKAEDANFWNPDTP